MMQTRKFKVILNNIRNTLNNNSPVNVCLNLINNNEKSSNDNLTSDFFYNLSPTERNYWIGNIYTNLIPSHLRKKLAAFLTPPYLSDYVINRLCDFGADLIFSRLLDPASGGAAFLTPLSISIIERLKKTGKTDDEIGQHICANLNGIEIEPNLAILSEAMLKDTFSQKIPEWHGKLSGIINNADALSFCIPSDSYDIVICNPPYGRIKKPSQKLCSQFEDIEVMSIGV